MSARSAVVALVAVAAAVAVIGFFALNPGERPDGSTAVAARGRSNTSDEPSPSPATVASDPRTPSLKAERTDALAAVWNDASHDVVGPVIEGTIVVSEMRDQKREEAEDGSFVPDFIDGLDSDADAGDPSHAPRRVAVKHAGRR
jgi:hypothetical protein